MQLSARMTNALHIAQSRGQQLDELLELCRPLLKLITVQSIGARLRRRAGDSEIIQMTMIEAHRDFAMFQGRTLAEFLAWIKRLHKNNILNLVRYHEADKRDYRREADLGNANESGISLSWYATEKSPRPEARLLNIEKSVELATAIARLPEAQRDAITMRHIEGLPLEGICQAMNRSPASVAGLLRRGLEALRQHTGNESSWF